MTQEQINVDLFNQVKRLEAELRNSKDQCAAANKGARINAKVSERLAEKIGAFAAENTSLRLLVQRARKMVDVPAEAKLEDWPSEDEIDQLIKDCDDILSNGKDDQR
ncbi:MAG: hypothetical protein IT576_02105 [Verrucomicrobiales bacterium]|nr:hypothetical protein [Verrucomicrobiales bacterium]